MNDKTTIKMDNLKSKEIAKKFVSEKRDFTRHIPSGKKARRLAWDIASEFGINPSITIFKRGRYYSSSQLETDFFSFHHDGQTKTATFVFNENEEENLIPIELRRKIEKLIPKTVQDAFEKQGYTGDKQIEDIKVICKLFNPCGAGTWYLYEHVEDDIYMCFANLGDPTYAELGTVSIIELAEYKGMFGLGIERDRHFKECSLKEIVDKVKNGLHV